MSIGSMFNDLNVTGTGLLAERTRMGIVATNIANAAVTGSDGGVANAYQRKVPVFETILEGELAGGVRVAEISVDEHSDHPLVHNPSHQHANENGYVKMPNVNMSFEMVDLMTAARAYDANLQAMRTSVQMTQRTLGMFR